MEAINMREITPNEADIKHGITTFHNEMDNGELRFRLKSRSDGTAYIRTVSQRGAWQESHKHLNLRETYVVQSGWMGYVEIQNGTCVFRICREGEIFTTQPGVIHSVYLPKGAVIHTVKHGKGSGEDRVVDSETKKLDEQLKSVDESELLRRPSSSPGPLGKPASTGAFAPSPPDPERVEYTDAYKHFDNLIWQVPAWTTGITAIVFAGVMQVKADNALVALTGLDVRWIVAVGCTLFGLFMLAASYALFRFRLHQTKAKTWQPECPWKSPQAWLQFTVNAQAGLLLLLALLAVGIGPTLLLLVTFVSFVVLDVLVERHIRTVAKGKKGVKPS
jgi:hypothetical protein